MLPEGSTFFSDLATSSNFLSLRAGTSMISLIIPPKVCLNRCARLSLIIITVLFQDQVSRASAMLTQEYGTASNIKSRVNRLSVLAAITSTQQRLKLYNRIPPNGLVLFVGTILTDEGKEKKVTFDFEPHKPINAYVTVFFFLLSYVLTNNPGRFIYVTTSFIPNRFLNSLKLILASALSLWMVTVPSSVLFLETREK